MRIRISAALVFLLICSAGRVEACSYPRPPSFQESLSAATSVFIFRLDQAQYKRTNHGPSAYSSEVEGKIVLVQNLYGNPVELRTIKFPTDFCGSVTLVVGRHYLIATSASGDTIELVRSDASVYDIEGFYSPSHKERSLRSLFVLPVIQAIYGVKALPDNFPPREIAGRTVIQSPPPPTP